MIINNLHVKKSDRKILNGINLSIESGIHVLMGPNGCGKTTLGYAITGHQDCEVLDGEILYKDENILSKEIHERSIAGIYLAPQYPPVIEGLSPASLLKTAMNIRLESQGKEALDEFDFLKKLRQAANDFGFDSKTYLRNSLNNGFSGGEKKRNEMLQISLLNPDFVILDEIDSGLDIEAMHKFSTIIKEMGKAKTILLVTHYPSFAQLVNANHVHIMKNGQIVSSGDISLAQEVEANGFTNF